MSKRKLLLADDSITIQKVVNLTFADEGIEVISVGDGDSAMRKFDEFIPDLVMADVNMPGLTGYEVCQIIKQNEVTRNIPVILLVGSFEPFDEEAAKNAGADDYLTKPFQSIRQLVNKVTELLNSAGAAPVEETPAPEPAAELAAVPDLDEPIPYQEAAPPSSEPATAAFADTLPYDDGAAPVADYGDSGFDDEMIETSPASTYGVEPASTYEPETTIDYAKTQPLNAADLKGFSLVRDEDDAPVEAAESATSDDDAYEIDADAEAGLYDYDTTPASSAPVAEPVAEETPAPFELQRVTDDPEEETEPATVVEEIATGPEAASEPEAVSEPEPAIAAETPAAVAEADDDTLELDVPDAETREPEVAETTEATDIESPTEEAADDDAVELEAPAELETPAETPVETTVAVDPAAVAEDAPEIDFDDGDLLELPPLVEETGIRPADAGFVSEVPVEVAEVPASAPAPAADSVQSFPPELIEAIAKKVAEQISAKTMADVLPQITELVMKKMAEEKKD